MHPVAKTIWQQFETDAAAEAVKADQEKAPHMRTIIAYELKVHRGARAGLVRRYEPSQRNAARRFADRLDLEYSAICASVQPIFA